MKLLRRRIKPSALFTPWSCDGPILALYGKVVSLSTYNIKWTCLEVRQVIDCYARCIHLFRPPWYTIYRTSTEICLFASTPHLPSKSRMPSILDMFKHTLVPMDRGQAMLHPNNSPTFHDYFAWSACFIVKYASRSNFESFGSVITVMITESAKRSRSSHAPVALSPSHQKTTLTHMLALRETYYHRPPSCFPAALSFSYTPPLPSQLAIPSLDIPDLSH